MVENIADRERLLAAALARRSRAHWILAGVVAFLAVAGALIGLLAAGRGMAGRDVLLATAPLAFFALVAAALIPIVRRRDLQEPALVSGADKATQRAVQAALRTGSSPDARIDALTRDSAGKTLRDSAQLRLFIVVAGVELVGATLQIIGGAGPGSLVSALCLLLVAGLLITTNVLTHRRSSRYLGRG
ncbi:hypothetical protein [Actinoplanes sp. TFC3]|uniref:hypothetical protein n=1 Tax=Actinoplanes sp. TFC3 TaxID=1710355 RepID=UPI000830D6EB|nr:hypothetical protein [Actinoplanes sp. TFC3]